MVTRLGWVVGAALGVACSSGIDDLHYVPQGSHSDGSAGDSGSGGSSGSSGGVSGSSGSAGAASGGAAGTGATGGAAGSGAAAGSDAGPTDAGPDASDAGACPVNLGFAQPSDSWSLAEGDIDNHTLSVTLGGTTNGDWTVSANNAPGWLAVPSTPGAGGVVLDASVPYAAAAASPYAVEVIMTRKLDGCVSKLNLEVEVENKLRAVALQSQINNVTAAVFSDDRGRFYVIDSVNGSVRHFDPSNPLSSATVPGLGIPVATAIAAGGGKLFVVVGNQLKVVDIANNDVDNGVSFSSTANLKLAYAAGFLFVAQKNQPSQVLAAPYTSAAVANPPSNVVQLATDGASFGVKQNTSPRHVGRLVPTDFADNGTPCNALNEAEQVAVRGKTVAWVDLGAVNNQLRFATDDNGCQPPVSIPFGVVGSAGHSVGLLSGDRALVLERLVPGSGLDAQIYDRSTTSAYGSGVANVPWAGGVFDQIAMSPRFALIYAGSTPVLLEL